MGLITLLEIEAAIPTLSDAELSKLVDQVNQAARVRTQNSDRKVVNLNRFAGCLKSDLDPLEYQREVRAEWD